MRTKRARTWGSHEYLGDCQHGGTLCRDVNDDDDGVHVPLIFVEEGHAKDGDDPADDGDDDDADNDGHLAAAHG